MESLKMHNSFKDVKCDLTEKYNRILTVQPKGARSFRADQ